MSRPMKDFVGLDEKQQGDDDQGDCKPALATFFAPVKTTPNGNSGQNTACGNCCREIGFAGTPLTGCQAINGRKGKPDSIGR